MLDKIKDAVRDTVEPKPHILEARQFAERIFNKTPVQQLEMLTEIRERLDKHSNGHTHNLQNA